MNAPGDFKAYRVERDPSTGRIAGAVRTLAADSLPKGDVLIRVRYAGLNFKDALATTQDGRVIRNLPRTGGSDAAGTVLSSTSGDFKAGEAVVVLADGFGVEFDGGFAQFARVPASNVMRVPAELSLLDAAALGVAGFTAALAVHMLQQQGLRPEHGKVLVNGATGGVGSFAIGMLARCAMQVTALTRKPEEAAALRGFGAAEVLTEVQDRGRPLEAAQWAAAVDSLGGEPLSWLLRSVQPRGIVASVGNAAGNRLDTSVLPFILRGVHLMGVNISHCGELAPIIWQRLASDLRPPPMPGYLDTIALDELPSAIDRMLARTSKGRTVVAFD